MSRYNLVIFDCDGVLVDSELITNRVLSAMLEELGLPLTLDDMFERFVGHSTAHVMSLIRDLLGRELPSGFVDEYFNRTGRALAEELQPVAGVHETLRALSIRSCVASNGEREKMRATLRSTGLLTHFEGRMYSAQDVARGKPAPDVFLLAASDMGVPPERCVVVEDTPIGVTAGCAAGMTVFGYAGRTPAPRLQAAGATVVFRDMAELPALLSE